MSTAITTCLFSLNHIAEKRGITINLPLAAPSLNLSGQILAGYRPVNSSNTDIATTYFLRDVPGATVPASRLRGILESVIAADPLSKHQQAFLHKHGYIALLRFACDEIDMETFRIQALQEQTVRLEAFDLAKKEEAARLARQAELTERRNAALFAEQEKRMARRRKLRELPDKYSLPFIDQVDLKRVNEILRLVTEGQPIKDDDLGWLAGNGAEYWTDDLRKAHHENLAEKLTNEWRQTKNAWKASSACGHWRKANRPEDRGGPGFSTSLQPC